MNYISKYTAEEIDEFLDNNGKYKTLTDVNSFAPGTYVCESLTGVSNTNKLPQSLQNAPAGFIMIVKPFVQNRMLGIIYSNNYSVVYVGKTDTTKTGWGIWTRVHLERDDWYDKNLGAGTTANRPAHLIDTDWDRGKIYFDTTINKLIVWQGTKWVDYMGNNV